MTLPAKNKFDPSFPITDKSDRATQLFRDYMTKLDALVTALTTGASVGLTNAANDAAAAAAGVPIGSLYRNGSIVQVRVV